VRFFSFQVLRLRVLLPRAHAEICDAGAPKETSEAMLASEALMAAPPELSEAAQDVEGAADAVAAIAAAEEAEAAEAVAALRAVASAEEEAAGERTWSCMACSYRNASSSTACDMCNLARPVGVEYDVPHNDEQSKPSDLGIASSDAAGVTRRRGSSVTNTTIVQVVGDGRYAGRRGSVLKRIGRRVRVELEHVGEDSERDKPTACWFDDTDVEETSAADSGLKSPMPASEGEPTPASFTLSLNPQKPLGLSIEPNGVVARVAVASQFRTQLLVHEATLAQFGGSLVGWRITAVNFKPLASLVELKEEIDALRRRNSAMDSPITFERATTDDGGARGAIADAKPAARSTAQPFTFGAAAQTAPCDAPAFTFSAPAKPPAPPASPAPSVPASTPVNEDGSSAAAAAAAAAGEDMGVDDENVATMMAMGFEPAWCEAALRRCDRLVVQAIEFCIANSASMERLVAEDRDAAAAATRAAVDSGAGAATSGSGAEPDVTEEESEAGAETALDEIRQLMRLVNSGADEATAIAMVRQWHSMLLSAAAGNDDAKPDAARVDEEGADGTSAEQAQADAAVATVAIAQVSAEDLIRTFGASLDTQFGATSDAGTAALITRALPLPGPQARNRADMLVVVEDDDNPSSSGAGGPGTRPRRRLPVFVTCTCADDDRGGGSSNTVIDTVLSVYVRRGRMPEPGEVNQGIVMRHLPCAPPFSSRFCRPCTDPICDD
jgi:hypothetical protein